VRVRSRPPKKQSTSGGLKRPRTGPTNPTWPAALNTLAIRLSETGDRAGAVAPAQEAVDLRRAQAAENRAYEPDLAAALNTLANRLSETGDRAGAVAPAQEAVDLYGGLKRPRTGPTNPTWQRR
jgi:hypothetical protein